MQPVTDKGHSLVELLFVFCQNTFLVSPGIFSQSWLIEWNINIQTQTHVLSFVIGRRQPEISAPFCEKILAGCFSTTAT